MLYSAWNSRHIESVNMMLLRVIDVSIVSVLMQTFT